MSSSPWKIGDHFFVAWTRYGDGLLDNRIARFHKEPSDAKKECDQLNRDRCELDYSVREYVVVTVAANGEIVSYKSA
jgi:hypothetical protein